MRLRLKDGSFANGKLIASQEPKTLGWHVPGFQEPFEFELSAMRSIALIVSPEESELPEPGAIQLVELKDGGVISGELLAVDDKSIKLKSDLLGTVQIRRDLVTTLTDAGHRGKVVYQGPLDAERWKASKGGWEYIGGTLRCNTQGTAIVGDVNLPEKAQVDLSLSWEDTPDFVLSLGTVSSNTISAGEQVPAAARLEVWDKQLALVREVAGGADIALVSDLTGVTPRIHLSVLIDQRAGVVTVCDSHGRPLDTVRAKSKRDILRSAIHLVNHGKSLTLESLEVREWDGRTRSEVRWEEQSVLSSDDQVYPASIVGFDAERRMLLLQPHGPDGPNEISLVDFRRGDLGLSEPEDHTPDDGEADAKAGSESTLDLEGNQSVAPPVAQPKGLQNRKSADSSQSAEPSDSARKSDEDSRGALTAKVGTEQPNIEVVLLDRTRFRGLLQPSKSESLRVSVPGLSTDEGDTLNIETTAIRGLIGSDTRFTATSDGQRSGTLKWEGVQLAGHLLPQSPEGSKTALFWQPVASANASEITTSASGAIVYRRQLPKVQHMGLIRIRRNANAATNRGNEANDRREILFRAGDSIRGVVTSIDEKGMHFKSPQTDTTFAKHDQVQHVWLNDQQSGPEYTAEEMQRLKTVPRGKKNDPPTHLLVAVNGDYLRGRLVSLKDGVLLIEVRLEVMEIPVDRVSRIIWLHDRDWEQEGNNEADGTEGDSPANEAVPTSDQTDAVESAFVVHAVNSEDKGLTFRPSRVRDGELYGESDLLGGCSVELDEVNQILFGRNMLEQIREFNNDPWVLSLAQYPRVYLDEEGGDAGTAGTQSALVGQQAIDFGLQELSGGHFRLSEKKGKVIVLDFWASWCGPCIQTMPLIESAIEEIDSDDVQLVAVNLQESEARVRAAVERLELHGTVLLDKDGEVAAAYEARAIPQTVIIDAAGNVTHIFVGGGSRMVGQFKAALQSVLEMPEQ